MLASFFFCCCLFLGGGGVPPLFPPSTLAFQFVGLTKGMSCSYRVCLVKY